MSQIVEEKPKIWLKDLNEHYATFATKNKLMSIRLDNLTPIENGVYKVKVFSNYCILDTNVPLASGGRELEVI